MAETSETTLPELDESRFYTVSQLAGLFKVSLTMVYGWVKTGRLRAIKFGGVIRIRRDEVERFIAELEEEAAARAS